MEYRLFVFVFFIFLMIELKSLLSIVTEYITQKQPGNELLTIVSEVNC